MKTAGYDIVVLLNEHFLSQVSGALLYNNFLTINGTKDLKEQLTPQQLVKIPGDLQHLLEIKYRFKMNFEPYIEFLPNNEVGITIDARFYLWFLQGLELKFDTDVTIIAPIQIQEGNFEILFDEARIPNFSVKYQQTSNHAEVMQINNILEEALTAYFKNKENPFRISIPTIEPEIPDTGVSIPVFVKAVKTINSSVLVTGINLVEDEGGDPNQLTEFAKNCNLAVAVSEKGMNKVYDATWDKLDKYIVQGDKISFLDSVDGIWDFASDILEGIISICSLGFLETDSKLKKADFNYEVGVKFKNKPRFDMLYGNKISIRDMEMDIYFKLGLSFDIWYEIEIDTSGFIPDSWTPWDDDKTIEKGTKSLELGPVCAHFHNIKIKEIIGEISLNEESNALECNVTKLDIYWDFMFPDKDTGIEVIDFIINAPEKLFNWILDLFEGKIAKAISPIKLSPALIVKKIDPIPWEFNIQAKKVKIKDKEAIAGANIYFEELQKNIFPVPKYIVNINNQEIHKAGCDSIFDTYETHQRGYYLLNDAKKHNDGCKKCLPAFHKK